MSDPETPTLWTIGHSTRALAEFMALLEQHGIEALADVRRMPQSRRHPHFSRDALARSLEAEGIHYRHFEALGGHRTPDGTVTNAGWHNEAFRGYADHMASAEFDAAIRDLLTLARTRRSAIMCAEADPAHCHRMLISDALVARGGTVEHIIGGGTAATKRHSLTDRARVEGDRVTYPADQLGLKLSESDD